MSRIIGCESLYIAKITKDDATGTTWETPKAVPSVIAIDIQDQTDTVTFYSDNKPEQVLPAFSGKEVSVELGYLSNELEAEICGYEYSDGALVQKADGVASEYALMWKAPKSKGGFSYCCLYKGVLTREESNYATKEDTVEGQTVTLSGVFMPLQSDGLVSIKADSDEDTPSALIPTWFTKVPKHGTGGSGYSAKSK